MDLLNGWDFDKGEDRRRAIKVILKTRPKLPIGSPPCTSFSLLQELNKAIHANDEVWMNKFRLRLEQAKRHIRFCIKLYKLQMYLGGYWLHEHPWSAKSWEMPEMEDLLNDPRTITVRTDMCQFGMVSHIKAGEPEMGPVLKPTGFIGNAWKSMRSLRRDARKSTLTYPSWREEQRRQQSILRNDVPPYVPA